MARGLLANLKSGLKRELGKEYYHQEYLDGKNSPIRSKVNNWLNSII